MLVRRFSESRRPHPLLPDLPVLEGVRFEKERLAELRRHADRIIDTSDLTVHELRDLLARQFTQDRTLRRLTISIITFGYKFGVPYDIDLLFDVRFLKNPFLFRSSTLTEKTRAWGLCIDRPDAVAFIVVGALFSSSFHFRA